MNGVVPTGQSPTTAQLKAAMDDNVLTPVAEHERKSGWKLLANTAGVGTTLALLLIGGTSSYAIGVGWTILAAAIAAVFSAAIGAWTCRVAQSTGMSSTVASRFHGLGTRGSILASIIFAWMIISFLALENALLYNGTLFLFGWEPSLANAIGIYTVLTLGWILLALFGLKIIQHTSLWLTLVAGALLFVILGVAISRSEVALGPILAHVPAGVDGLAFITVLSGMVGFAGALALTGADFARYARTPKDADIMAIGGAIIVNFGVVSMGALIYQIGDTVVADFLGDPANAAMAASQPGATIAEKVQFLAHQNAGAYFVILAGIIGFIVMYAAQVKAQAVNAYASSLSLSNLWDAITRRRANRVVMVVVANILAMVAVGANLLGFMAQFLAALGVATFALCALMISDLFLVRRGRPAPTGRLEEWNWAGMIALVVGFAVPYTLQITGIVPPGFLLALVLTPAVYVSLRRTLLPEGTGTKMVAATAALKEIEEESVSH